MLKSGLVKMHSLRYRARMLGAKRDGYFPQTSWAALLRLLRHPTVSWPHPAFAVPTRRDGALVEYRTPLGAIWGSEEDRAALGATALEILSGVYEDGGARMSPGSIVIDLGAHLGTFTRLALGRGAARVIAVEALPQSQECLRRTFAGEIAAGRVTVVPSAVWSERKTLHFSGNSLTGHVSEEGLPVEAVTIDELARDLQLPRVDFIKADIEGAERHALAGAADTVARWRPKISFCTYHYPDDPAVLSGLLKGLYAGYRIAFESSGRYIYATA